MEKRPANSQGLTERLADRRGIEEALRDGARAAVLRHKRDGIPLVGVENGHVVIVPASEVSVPPTADPSQAA